MSELLDIIFMSESMSITISELIVPRARACFVEPVPYQNP